MKFRLLIIFVLCFLISNNLEAQNYNIKSFNIQDGLAQSQVLSLFQDKLGNLWIGTNGGGISIYNGNSFKTFQEENEKLGKYVFSITSDLKGRIWFGTDKGASYFDGFKIITFDETNGLPNNRVYNVTCDEKGKIWLGTDKGVATFDGKSISIIEGNETLKSIGIFSIFIDKKKNKWFGTLGKGFFKYDEKTFEHFIFPDSLKYLNSIRSFAEEQNSGDIFIGTYDGLLTYSKGKITNHTYLGKKENRLTVSRLTNFDNKIWFIRYDGKLIETNYLNKKIEFDLQLEIGKIKLYSVLVDNEKNIWIGSDNGLYKVPQIKFMNIDESNNLHNNNVSAICKIDTNTFLVGATKKAIAKIKILKNNIVDVEKISYEDTKLLLSGSQISSIIKTKEGKVWIGTNKGLSLYKNNEFFSYIPSNENEKIRRIEKRLEYVDNLTSDEIKSLFEDSKGNLWIGTINGVTKLSNNEFYNFNNNFPELKKRLVWNILEDNKHNIWFATDLGAFYFDGKNLNHFGEKQGFIDDMVVSIVQDGGNNYWFGTKKGIFRFDYTFLNKTRKTTQIIDKSNGLSSNNIYLLILDDKQQLFIGTEKGIDILNTVDFNSEKEISIRNFSQVDGFIGQECNLNACYKGENGKMYFGTVKGLTVYDPKYDFKNELEPITQITKIQLNYKDFDWSEYSNGTDSVTGLPRNLILPYNLNHLTFEFVAASLTTPEKVKYQYVLEGLNEDWSPAKTKNEADYPSLPNGKYKLKVKACNNDGVWNEIPTVFEFEILPPIWKTWWFYTILSILSIIIIVLYIKWRESNLKKDKIILEQKVEERTLEVVTQKEIVEQKNKDITDSINYAKNIQEAILVNIAEIKQVFPDSFILFNPRDIVSGDFYWFKNRGNSIYIAAADCTGHGVPGAFMSMLGLAFLNELVSKEIEASSDEMLNKLRQNVMDALHQTGREGEQKDGMDIALCKYNKLTHELQFSGANNPLYFVKKQSDSEVSKYTNDEDKFSILKLEYNPNVLIEIKPDKMPIGLHIRQDNFTNHKVFLETGDSFYLFSDGYADQFGGPQGKKFKYKPLKEMLLKMHDTPMSKQNDILQKTLSNWRGNHEQIDDILVIGVKII